MNRWFSFCLMGAFGFSAAVGASSFGTSTISFDEAEFEDVTTADDVKTQGFGLTGRGASITVAGEGNAVFLRARSETSVFDAFENVSYDEQPRSDFLTFKRLDGSPFEFESVRVFSLPSTPEEVLSVFAYGTTANGLGFAGDPVAVSGAQILTASNLGVPQRPISSFGLSVGPSGAGGGGSSAENDGGNLPTLTLASLPLEQTSETDPEQSGIVVDDVTFETTTPVPLPAPGLMLAGALFGVGVWSRRRKAG